MRMVAHRIADPRVLRLITQWLRAGVMEKDEWHETTVGTLQGASISPLLANTYLHYALDLWVQRCRRRTARGRVSIVRYADDFVMGFQAAPHARQMRADLQERLQYFGLQLHEEKTRVIEFGRLPALAHKQRGEHRLGTFAFLGFTHYCGWTRDGRFIVMRKTQRQRVKVKLKTLKDEAKRRRHEPVRLVRALTVEGKLVLVAPLARTRESGKSVRTSRRDSCDPRNPHGLGEGFVPRRKRRHLSQ